MENQASSKSIILNYGLYLGIIGVITHLCLFATGQLLELNWINSLVWFIALIIFTVLGIKNFKASSGGYISWGKGLKIGMGITMICAIITVVYILLFLNVIDPEFQNQAVELQRQAWVDAGMTSDQIESSLEAMEMFQGPVISSALILAFSAFIGFIITAIISAIMKQNPEEQY
jgi:hypothetical protein